jgi:hypothetical protein
MRHVLTGLVAAVVFASLTIGSAHSAAGAGCHVSGALQDARCTPGLVVRNVTAKMVCRPGYAGSVRNVPESEKRQVFVEYGMSGTHHGGAYEVDHLISLELGGSNDVRNLWPEAASPHPGFHQKDALENKLHALVCAGSMTLRKAQHLIRTDWLAAYRIYVAQ